MLTLSPGLPASPAAPAGPGSPWKYQVAMSDTMVLTGIRPIPMVTKSM